MLWFGSIRPNWHESSPLLSTRKRGSRFARDVEFVAPLGFQSGLKMLRFVSIRSNRHESSPLLRFVIPEVDLRRLRICSVTGLWGWVENVAIRVDSTESTWIVSLVAIRKRGSRFARDLEFVAPLGFHVGLKMLRFVSIRLNRHESSPLLSIRKRGSRFALDLEFVALLGFEDGLKMLRKSCLLLSIRKRGSRFARDLEFVAPLGFQGGLKMLRFVSIRSNPHELSPLLRFVILEVDLRRT